MATLRLANWRDGGQQMLSDLGRRLARPFTAHCQEGVQELAVRQFRRPQVAEILVKLGMLFGSLGISVLLSMWIVEQMDPNSKAKKEGEKARKTLMTRLGRTDVETDKYENMISKEAIDPASIDVTFEDIGGLLEEKQRLRDIVVLPFSRPELFSRGALLRAPKGVLLYGPPGTGKTMLAKAIAKETKAVFLNISLSTLQNKWFGESQKLVKAVFTLAWKVQPCIIFIDEIDSFLRERKDGEFEASNNMKSEFMALWDGIGTDQSSQVIVVGATNRPWAIDKAILRRMPRPFLIDLPDAKQRADIVRKVLSKEHVDPGFDYQDVAKQTQGYSGSDLKELCRASLMQPLRDLLEDEARLGPDAPKMELRALTAVDVIMAKEHVQPTAVEADEYLRRATGMDKAKFEKYLNGQSV
ncbi:P-loop containing nucleoside triphosphate hydrolase protein [Baffinella frigidus]|nr:P-loop containing nucleoside triphosphate hydrolase protein [Cryptophyta sp. CCMP2293]